LLHLKAVYFPVIWESTSHLSTADWVLKLSCNAFEHGLVRSAAHGLGRGWGNNKMSHILLFRCFNGYTECTCVLRENSRSSTEHVWFYFISKHFMACIPSTTTPDIQRKSFISVGKPV